MGGDGVIERDAIALIRRARLRLFVQAAILGGVCIGAILLSAFRVRLPWSELVVCATVLLYWVATSRMRLHIPLPISASKPVALQINADATDAQALAWVAGVMRATGSWVEEDEECSTISRPS